MAVAASKNACIFSRPRFNVTPPHRAAAPSQTRSLCHSKRRGLSKYTTNARDAAEAAARSASAAEYLPLLESLVKKADLIESQSKAGLVFPWNSPLEGMSRTYKLGRLSEERGMAWMLRAACKRQEAALAVADRPRAPAVTAGQDDDAAFDRPLHVVGGSVLDTPGRVGTPGGGGGSVPATPPGSARSGAGVGTPGGTPGGHPRSPGPVLGEAAPAVATTLREAAGLYKHAAEKVLPELKGSLAGERPNELLASMATTMRLVCLAEAQAATARRAEEKGTAPSLLCKLHVGAYDLFKSAEDTIGGHVSDFNFIAKKLQAYVLLGICVHRARAHRAAAEEAAAGGDIGEAIACCDAAKKHLAKCQVAAGEVAAWQRAVAEEGEALAEVRANYVRENEVVYFEKVPEKPARKLPDGKVIVAEIEHVPSEMFQNLFVE